MNRVYAFIEAEKATHGVALLCRVLDVARSSFYAWLTARPAAARRQEAEDELATERQVVKPSQKRGQLGP